MLNIRPFDIQGDDDYIRANQIEQEYYPDREGNIEEQRWYDVSRSEAGPLYVREALEIDGAMIGFGAYRRADSVANKYGVHLIISRAFTRRGLGSGYLQHVYDRIAAFEPEATVTQNREDQPEALAFLAKHGYKQTLRTCRSELDVGGFDSAEYAPAIERVEKAGYRLHTLAELQKTDPDWLQKTYDVNIAGLRDVPMSDSLDIWPLELWAKNVLSRPSFSPDLWVIAVTPEDEYAGISMLRRAADPKEVNVGLTGVEREHRRRGLCTAMKVRAIEAGQALGAEIMKTSNEENNPMLGINLRLGFQVLPARLDFERVWE